MIIATLGGVTVGLGVLLRVLILWYPGWKALRKKTLAHIGALAPFLVGSAYGMLGILTGMGIIGWAFDTALWASNWLGDAALWLGVGEDVGQAAGTTFQPLNVYGNCLMVLATVAFFTAIKLERYRQELVMGGWCGLCLGTSSTVAGLMAVPLAQGANWLGATVYGPFA